MRKKFMKECRVCGMPLEKKTEEDVCDYCRNDDGVEMLAKEDDDDFEM